MGTSLAQFIGMSTKHRESASYCQILVGHLVPRSAISVLLPIWIGCVAMLAGCESGGETGDPDENLGGASGVHDERAAAECLSSTEPEWIGPWDNCDEPYDPGFHVCTDEAAGGGECTNSTLREIIELTHETFPDLGSATDLYNINENDGESGLIVYAFTAESGFRLVFEQGSGDCPSGCTEATWTYVETDENCEPQIVGEYDFTNDGCTGEPMWGLPCSEHQLGCGE